MRCALCVVGLIAACGTQHATGSATFMCGDLACETATQYCSVVEPSRPGGSASYACIAADGGMPSCGSNAVSSPMMCGCYVSPAGEVTVTTCPP